MSSSREISKAEASSDARSYVSAQSVMYGGRGFPRKCSCGSDVNIYTSQSKNNPGRPYFRCATRRENGHVFKWVEDGMLEEVEDIREWIGRRETDVGNEQVEFGEMKSMVIEMKEEMNGLKIALKKTN